MGILVKFPEDRYPPPTPGRQAYWRPRRERRLREMGFAELQVMIMRNVRFHYPEARRVLRWQERRLRYMQRVYKISREEAAERLRVQAEERIHHWREVDMYEGLPPEEDPIVQMGYRYA